MTKEETFQYCRTAELLVLIGRTSNVLECVRRWRRTKVAPFVFAQHPESGIYPEDIEIVVNRLLRTRAPGARLVIMTHSPLVVNEVPVESVVHIGSDYLPRRLVDSKRFEERSKVYMPGELWLAYIDSLEWEY